MGITIRVGILIPEDPTDPTSRLIVTWPSFRGPEDDGCSARYTLPGYPTRAMNHRAFQHWHRQRFVRPILASCGVPADVDTLINAPIDQRLLTRITALHANATRWAWLPWADRAAADRAQWLYYWTRRARETFADRAHIGFS